METIEFIEFHPINKLKYAENFEGSLKRNAETWKVTYYILDDDFLKRRMKRIKIEMCDYKGNVVGCLLDRGYNETILNEILGTVL